MKQISACLFCLSGVVVVSLAGAVSAERPSVGIGVSDRHGVHHDKFERNRFIYSVGNIGEIEDMRDAFSGRSRAEPSYPRLDQLSENEGNDDSNMSNGMGNQTMTPSADIPDSVHGLSRAPNVLPNIRPEGDPSVRDLSSGGPSDPSGPPTSFGR